MPDLVISNTSPLLYLHQAGCLQLLPELYGEIVVPTAVEQELLAGQRQGVDVPVVGELDWCLVRSVSAMATLPTVVDLGQGEAEVIAIGLETPGSLLILDDQLGRRIARFYELTLTGTLGVLIKAKQQGLLEEIAPVMKRLQQSGMWLTEQIVRDVLGLAGESEDRAK